MSCGRGIFIGIYAALIFATAIYCLFKLYKHMGRISYEMIPLSTCAMQSLLHFINVIFLITNSLQIVIIYFCLQTFILIAQSFMHLYYKVTAQDFQRYQRFQKYSMITFYVIFTSIMIAFLISIDDQNCIAYFDTGLILQFLIMSVSVLLCWLFGNKLKSLISNRESTKEIITATQQTTTIQLVLSTSTTLIFVMSILAVTEYRGLLCNLPLKDNNEQGFTSGENVYLTFFSMLEMTPCILVPVIFFYLPQISSQDDNESEFLLNEQKTVSYRQSLDFSGLMSKSIELHQ